MRNFYCVAAAASLIAAAPASAAVYIYEYTGVVTDIQRNSPPFAVALGDGVSIKFKFDSSAAVLAEPPLQPDSALYDVVLTDYSASVGSYDRAMPSIAGRLFITDGDFDAFTFSVDDKSIDGGLGVSALGPSTARSDNSLAAAQSFEGLPDQMLLLAFGSGPARGYVVGQVRGSVRVEGAVPEPATWAMMVSGFGLIGAAMRRRRGERRAENA